MANSLSIRHDFPHVDQGLGPLRQLLKLSRYELWVYLAILVAVWGHGHTARSAIGCLSPLAACTVPAGVMEASPQGGGFQGSPSLNHPSPVSEVCGVFSHGPLPSRTT